MNRKAIFRLSRGLFDALHQLEGAEGHTVSVKTQAVLDSLDQLTTAIGECGTRTEVQELLQQLNPLTANTQTLMQSSSLATIKKNVEQILTFLDIHTPEMIFLLTAPFDEEARTGDGQYAKTLVQGFSQYSTTSCIWLKQKDQHYSIPRSPGLQPIPANSIPTVFVLQPVANKRTVLSGYSCETLEQLDTAIEYIKGKITLRTPQVILGPDKKLLRIGFMSGNREIIFGHKEVVEQLALVTGQLADLKDDKKIKIIKQLNKYKEDICRVLFDKENKEKAVKLFEDMVQYLEQQGNKGVISKDGFAKSENPTKYLADIIKPWGSLRDIQKVKIKKSEMKNALLLLTSLQKEFEASHYDKLELITALEQLSGIRESFYDFVAQRVGKRHPQKIDGIAEFYKVLEIAKADKDRQNIIRQLAETMKKLGKNRKLGVDIHIRVPDTGAFIMPADIAFFRKEGIRVNITVHEYKQNYTRRFLQKMVHDLLREANSVLFFNEKDKKNAVSATESGDLDKERKEKGAWPISMYNLKNKVGLTVASQVLSGTSLLKPKQVLQKEPNILCFGTIRPGKGFEEALEIASSLKKRAEGSFLTFKGIVIISGDPQNTKLMEQLFAERYGAENLKQYQSELKEPSVNYETMDSEQKRSYWKNAKMALELRIKVLNNPSIEIHPWCEPEELAQLKQRSKYVCRMDDMGMRNNGSAIISVLDVGVIYTKWGCVTDSEYYPLGEDKDKGIYGDAVDLGKNKYGLHQAEKKWDEKKKSETSFKRDPMARHPVDDILASILKREEDQQQHEGDLTMSVNYQTVVMAQKLLTERFTLQNGVLNLLQAFVLDEPESFFPQLVGEAIASSPKNPNRYKGIVEQGVQANHHLFFNGQQVWGAAQLALNKEGVVDNNGETVESVPVTGIEFNLA
ncbi:hypothetical protein ACD661_08140 [Legionella lytica]|uniref:Coiled-coil protein n=1 Tax=Legionella lytica TaxID=96232 RepID=A0ABW8D737_9GAMM